MELFGEEILIIGMDLFHRLGYEIHGVPFTLPQKPVEVIEKEKKEVVRVDLPDSVGLDGFLESWRKVLADNQALPLNSKCKLAGAELHLKTSCKPIWIRQYPIAEGLKPAVTEQVQTWRKTGTII